MDDQIRARIEDTVKKNPVVLFMKGNRSFPQCGFSATVVSILNQLLPSYETVNVLAEPAIRDAIKEYSEWPTIPQLYVKGEFVGGCDIIKSLHASGELQQLLGVTMKEVAAPRITLTPAAARAFAEAGKEAAGQVLRIEADARFQYDLYFGEPAAGDLVVTTEGRAVHVDRASAARLDGVTIDFIEDAGGSGFKLTNPNEPARVRQLTPAALKARLSAGEKLELFDVRTPAERAIASLGARLLDEEGTAYLLSLPRETPVVFHCHHGGRSQAAAERFLQAGFTQLYNLEGGIDAWSQTVDPSVPRY